MWRQGTCRCSSVEHVFSPVSLKKKSKRRAKEQQDVQEKPSVSDPPDASPVEVLHPVLAPVENKDSVEVEDEWTKHAFSVADATDAAAAAAAEAADQARKALHSLKGTGRLKSHFGGDYVKHQTSKALQYMQTQFHLQSQVRSRRVEMSQQSQALQRQLLHARELENMKVGDKWDDSLLSKEQTEANLFEKYEAATRRERCEAYSDTHQQTWNKPKNNPLLGWIWLDRWMTANQPLESTHTKAGIDNNSHCSAGLRFPAGDIAKCLACRLLNPDNPSSSATQMPHCHHTPSTACSKTGSSSSARKLISASHNECTVSQDDDSKNTANSLSERYRRHTIMAPLAREDKSLISPPSVPSYMAPTQSTKSKVKLPSSKGIESGRTSKKLLTGSAKKQHSYPPGHARTRRHLGQSSVGTCSVVEENDSNGTPVGRSLK